MLDELKQDEITIDHREPPLTIAQPVIKVIKEHPLKNRKRSPATRARISASHRKRNLQAQHDAELRTKLDSIVKENLDIKSRFELLEAERNSYKTQLEQLMDTVKSLKQAPQAVPQPTPQPTPQQAPQRSGFRW
jgi:septal ring factor EnvC (AmiA/AmiB activator)